MEPSKIAVIGSGVSGLSAAWLLSQRHDVVLFECDDRLGGHANTATIETCDGPRFVDTGFIVYNAPNYPNLSALFSYLGIATMETEMSFSVSLRGGQYEYSGTGFGGYFGQRRNLLNLAHWQVLKDISRFFNSAERKTKTLDDDVTLGAFLSNERYSCAFINHHILPMAGAIWSATPNKMLAYPARSFISFYANHGMLQFKNRPLWRTVIGGSQAYVQALLRNTTIDVHKATTIKTVVRKESGVEIIDSNGGSCRVDHVVIAAHADQSLAMLDQPTREEREVLSAFAYQKNQVVLHRDPRAMPKRRGVWSSWNYIQPEQCGDESLSVTYWMNSLQKLNTRENIFVTLNPTFEIEAAQIDAIFHYTHPLFSTAARRTQTQLWKLQGKNRTWFCGSYFGHGFHEDGLQIGLAVAEQLGGVRRPWLVDCESDRIILPTENTTLESA